MTTTRLASMANPEEMHRLTSSPPAGMSPRWSYRYQQFRRPTKFNSVLQPDMQHEWLCEVSCLFSFLTILIFVYADTLVIQLMYTTSLLVIGCRDFFPPQLAELQSKRIMEKYYIFRSGFRAVDGRVDWTS